jgi:hypothetical protein
MWTRGSCCMQGLWVVVVVLLAATLADAELISGHAFRQLAEWNADAKYGRRMPTAANDLKNGDAIFFRCYPGAMDDDFKAMRERAKDGLRFKLFIHNCDESFNPDANELKLLGSFMSRVYALNSVCGEACMPLVQPIPIGFVDNSAHKDKAHHVFERIAKQKTHKVHTVFMNFRLHNSGDDPKRLPCRNYFKLKPWVFFKEYGLAPGQTYEITAQSKYILSPPGAGIDCHRTYEAIFLGAIPILLSSELDYLYRHLPIVIVDSWTDITEEFLNDNYEAHRKALNDWRDKYRGWSRAEFWVTGGDLGPFGGYASNVTV